MTMLNTGMVRHAEGGGEAAALGAAGVVSRLGGRVWRGFRGNPTRFLGRAVLVAWAGFWTWFIGAHFVSEGWTAVKPGGTMLAIFLGVAAVGLRWPRLGSVVLLGAAGVAYWFFNNPGAWSLLATPLVVAALLLPWERRG